MFGSTQRICDHTFVRRFINSDSIVLDLGANQGEFAHKIIKRFGCRVISAEPLIDLWEKIDRHPLLELHNTAVGGKNQNIEMNVYSERCASVYGPVATDESMTTRTVPMITLAELCRLSAVDRVDLLKLDIEGAEIDLFDACGDNELSQIKQITVEFHEFIYPDQHDSVLRIHNRLASLGFWVIPFRLDGSDALFVNRATGISAAEVAYLQTIVKYSNRIVRRLRRTASSIGLLDDPHGYCKTHKNQITHPKSPS